MSKHSFNKGDRVYWTDPGEDLASGPGTITHVQHDEDDAVISIALDDKGVTEALPHELRLINATDQNLPENFIDEDGEVVVELADGCSLRSGVYEGGTFVSGEYVRLCDPKGEEILYWDQQEWKDDPALVMGAIINAAAGLRK